jgi:hypothetical protein
MLNRLYFPSIEKKAYCKIGLKKLKEALIDVDSCIAIAPRYIESYSLGAHISLLINDYYRMKDYCVQGLRVKEDSRFYLFKTIAGIKSKQDFKLIKEELDFAAKIFPNDEINISEAWIYYSFAFKDDNLCKLIKEYEIANGKLKSILEDERFDKRYKECVAAHSTPSATKVSK